SEYSPAEKPGSVEYVYLMLSDDLVGLLLDLHTAANININQKALDEPSEVFCYFARLTDAEDRKLTAVKRASQFKGVLKNRLIRVATDALKMVDDKVFKLDADFDLLVDERHVHVLRPKSFELLLKLQSALLGAVSENIAIIRADLPFVAFDPIESYSATKPRAARLLASIRCQGEMKNVDQAALRSLCSGTSVTVQEIDGQLVVDDPHVLGFLEVLDRRRYRLELVPGEPEPFRAASRTRIRP
ncbi:MAG: DUF4868 domain-containing protein, partial [Coriobacteriia bacterium]|nr:DUF4868 domain-containing protein [Coriobacteriia bacterium]